MRRQLEGTLSMLLALLILSTLTNPAGAHGLRERQEELEREREEVEQSIDVARTSDRQLEAELEQLDVELGRRRAEAAHAEQELRAAEAAVIATRTQIDELQSEVDQRQTLLDDRIADIYVHSMSTSLAALPEATDSVLDAARREALATRAARADDELIAHLEVAKTDLDTKRRELEAAEAAAEVRARTSRSAVDAVEATLSEKDRVHVALQDRIEELLAEAEALAKEEDRIRGLLARLQAPRPNIAAVASNPGGFIWPTNGVVTSEYGQRWGRLHAGIDIAAPTGTAIRAAAPGVVISSGAQGGYGNVVIVDHGRGLATLYAHQSSIGVSNGTQVDQGDVLGAVGCTGSCTGPHLHFEVRANGDPQNPRNYLP